MVYEYYPISLGNPHWVIFVDKFSRKKKSGPYLEHNLNFPGKMKALFAKIMDQNTIVMEILEPGDGYTLVSGSNAWAVFAISRKLNLCSDNVEICMP
jgi:diaminopimelate epimerase